MHCAQVTQKPLCRVLCERFDNQSYSSFRKLQTYVFHISVLKASIVSLEGLAHLNSQPWHSLRVKLLFVFHSFIHEETLFELFICQVCFEKRLVVAHDLDHPGGDAKRTAYGELGEIHAMLGNYEQAISCMEHQLQDAK